jgi:hypothetical protein
VDSRVLSSVAVKRTQEPRVRQAGGRVESDGDQRACGMMSRSLTSATLRVQA